MRMLRGLTIGLVLACAGASLAEGEGFEVVREYVGHGVGRALHEDPQVPNYGVPGRGPVIKPGLVVAIEPMINVGDWRTEVLDDDWTVVEIGDANHLTCIIKPQFKEEIRKWLASQKKR